MSNTTNKKPDRRYLTFVVQGSLNFELRYSNCREESERSAFRSPSSIRPKKLPQFQELTFDSRGRDALYKRLLCQKENQNHRQGKNGGSRQ